MHVTKLLFQELKVRPTLTPEEHRRFHFCVPGGLQEIKIISEPSVLKSLMKFYSSRIDLPGLPLGEAGWTLHVDGSSCGDKGNKKASYAVVSLEGVVEAKALLPRTSAQEAQLIALTRALKSPHEKRVNVYTYSR